MKRLILLAGSFVCLTATCAVYDVRDFGAKGDGSRKDTAVLQKAIDAAHEAGGGTVRTYLLACNTTGKRLKARVPLGAEQFGDMRTVHGGGVSMAEGNALAVDFPPEGYAFLSFKIRKADQ